MGAEVLSRHLLQDLQYHLVSPPVYRRPYQPLPPHLLEEGVELHLQGDPREGLTVVPEGRPRRFREVVQGAVD